MRTLLLSLALLLGAGSAWGQTIGYPPPSLASTILFGTGSDGNFSCSSGTIVLSRDMNYTSLTISGSCQVYTNGYRIFVNGTLDLTNAGANAIFDQAGVGQNASGATAGNGIGSGNVHMLGGGSGVVGGAGGYAGGNGSTGAASNGTNGFCAGAGYWTIGGDVGGAGAGGAGASGAGGAGGAGVSASSRLSQIFSYPQTTDFMFHTGGNSQTWPVLGGCGGAGGGGGSGDGTNSGGGGGGGASGGGMLALYARFINRGPNTAVGAIASLGLPGGNGANGVAGNTGGGGGGDGGGGGFVYITAEALLGSQATAAVDVSGGNGGQGGAGVGTGAAGHGGSAGNGGNYQIITLSPANDNVGSFNQAASSAPSGQAGGVAATVRGNL